MALKTPFQAPSGEHRELGTSNLEPFQPRGQSPSTIPKEVAHQVCPSNTPLLVPISVRARLCKLVIRRRGSKQLGQRRVGLALTLPPESLPEGSPSRSPEAGSHAEVVLGGLFPPGWLAAPAFFTAPRGMWICFADSTEVPNQRTEPPSNCQPQNIILIHRHTKLVGSLLFPLPRRLRQVPRIPKPPALCTYFMKENIRSLQLSS